MGKDLKGKELGEGLSQRKDGRYCARYTDYYGKRKTIYSKNLKEVKELLRKALYEDKLASGSIPPEDLTLDELFKIWRAWKEVEVKGSSLSGYIRSYNNHIKPTFGSQKLRNIQTIHVQSWINELHDKLKKASVSSIKYTLNNMFKFAIDKKYLVINPCMGAKVKMGKIDLCDTSNRQKFLTEKQLNILFEYAEKHKHKHLLLYKFMLLTGLRISEALALQWSDISFDNKIVSITKTVSQYYIDNSRKIVRDQLPKTKTSIRVVPLCDDAIEILKQQLQSKYTSKKVVFLSSRLTPMTVNGIDSSFSFFLKKLREEVDFPIISPHVFRHTFATRCLKEGIPPKVVQKILGHSTLAMTMDLYTHIPDDYMKDCVKKISL